MGKKKMVDDMDQADLMEEAKEAHPTGDASAADAGGHGAPSGAQPGMVRVVNLTKGEWEITLTDGTHLRMGPWSKGGGAGHISRAVLRKVLPPPVKKMVHRREIRIEEAK